MVEMYASPSDDGQVNDLIERAKIADHTRSAKSIRNQPKELAIVW